MKKLFVLGLFISFLTNLYAMPGINYNWPENIPEVEDFDVWINDERLILYNTDPAALGIFKCTDSVEVRIKSIYDIKKVDIRPLAQNTKFSLDNDVITFYMRENQKLSVELNGEHTRVLYLFANSMPEKTPEKGSNVHFFTPGRIHDVGVLKLNSDDKVVIPGGAVVKGAIYAEDADRIQIMGNGILDCTGNQGLRVDGWKKKIRSVYIKNSVNSTIKDICIVNSKTWTIEPVYCENMKIYNVKIVNWDYGSDGIDMVGCKNIEIDECFIRANDDCIVIKSWAGEKYDHKRGVHYNVQNIVVQNSILWNMAWGNAMEIGFELRTEFISDILFKDIDVLHVDRGAVMSIHNGDFAEVTDIKYKNIRIEDAQHKLIDLAVFLSQYSLDRPVSKAERKRRYMHGAWDGVLWVPVQDSAKYEANRGHISNISFDGIYILDGDLPFSVISGYGPTHQVKNVEINDLYFRNQKITSFNEADFYIEHARNLLIQ
jgi:hypothetical protein